MTTVDVYVDPSCPWAWNTSRWIKEVALHRDLTVSWQLEPDSITVQVSDASPDRPERRRPGLYEPNGRGLTIVDALSDEWGYDHHASGKHVWARIPVRTTYAAADRRVAAH